MEELGEEATHKVRTTLPPKPVRGHFVQTDRATHEAWARLGAKNAAASALLHVLVANVGEHNAVVASHKVLAALMGASVSTVKRGLKVLEEGNWIEIQQIGASGTVNAYVVNSRVAWTESRDKLRYARLQAEVILAEDEQVTSIDSAASTPLHRLPRLGEIQVPSGNGLPPVSQPSFPGMEADLPAFGRVKEPSFLDESDR